MIPKLEINEDFYHALSSDANEETVKYFKQKEEPYSPFGDNSIPVYPKNSEYSVGKVGLYKGFTHAALGDYGYCPTEMGLIKYLKPFAEDKLNYMVTVRLIDIETAKNNESYATYVDEEGIDTEMEFYEYFDAYGLPNLEYENCLIHYSIFMLY